MRRSRACAARMPSAPATRSRCGLSAATCTPIPLQTTLNPSLGFGAQVRGRDKLWGSGIDSVRFSAAATPTEGVPSDSFTLNASANWAMKSLIVAKTSCAAAPQCND